MRLGNRYSPGPSPSLPMIRIGIQVPVEEDDVAG